MQIHEFNRIGAFLLGALLCAAPVNAALSQKQARKLISKAAGMSLPTSAIRIESINSTNESTVEVATELALVFRFSRDDAGRWRIREVRLGEARWEDVKQITQVARVDIDPNKCDPADEFGRVISQSDLKAKQARCLVANLFDVVLPSDAVRIKEVSGLSLGSQPSAIVETLVRADFRLQKSEREWRVSEFRSGNRPWINLDPFPAALDSLKRTQTAADMNSIATALEAFHRARGSFVIAKKHAVLIDHLSPGYLQKVIRLDAWQRPYSYQGDQDHFILRSSGPDGKENTPDDIVVSR
ncbi:MAG TPA: type II secretion system protein GspG [Pyrinomonadaceae bacterium]|nr:type II secretion system protein GspG [Pyrinomonadaceae bacterium]